jgi:hypothetical protein
MVADLVYEYSDVLRMEAPTGLPQDRPVVIPSAWKMKHAMNQRIPPYMSDFVIVYLDDNLIFLVLKYTLSPTSNSNSLLWLFAAYGIPSPSLARSPYPCPMGSLLGSFAVQFKTETKLHFWARWLASLSLHCTSVSTRVQELGSIYSSAQRDSRQLRYGFSYVRALPCCVSMTAVLGTSPATTERTAYAQLARRPIA